MHANRRPRGVPALLFLGFVTALAGCGSSGRIGLLGQVPDATVSERELSAQVHDLIARSTTRVQEQAVLMYREAQDLAERQAAIVLATRINEEIVRASYHGDPVAILVDLWTLCIQLRLYAESDLGAWRFGARRDDIAALFGGLEVEAAALAAGTAGGPEAVPDLAPQVEAWASRHPIRGALMERASTAPLLASLAPPGGTSLLAAADTLEQGMDGLAYRMELMTSRLPAQIVWLAAAMVDAKLGDLDGPALLDRLDRAIDLLEGMPGEIDVQRVATLKTLREERIAILDALSAERVAILDAVGAERVEIFRAIDAQRLDTMEQIDALWTMMLADVDRQRVEALAQIDEQRVETLAELEGWIAGLVDAVDEQRRETLVDIDATVAAAVDRSAERLLFVGGVYLVAIFFGLLVLMVVARLLWRPVAAS